MSVRKIVKIDEDLCDGCGVCVPSCAEGAIQVIDGKAKLVSEIYCDGLGACLGECPQDAISIEEREAQKFDEEAVEKHLAKTKEPEPQPQKDLACGCPGSAMQSFGIKGVQTIPMTMSAESSALGHWPVQLMLVPPLAPFLKEADLLICADCVPFTVPDFHARYLAGKAVLVGCPKLDNLDLYRQKLKEIFAVAKPTSITVLRMEVPCCGGIVQAVIDARNDSAPHLPVVVYNHGIKGGFEREVSQPKAA
jgi:Pyruvate/2-oxoacid:ferredoxin oxidoreductase delta subunit